MVCGVFARESLYAAQLSEDLHAARNDIARIAKITRGEIDFFISIILLYSLLDN